MKRVSLNVRCSLPKNRYDLIITFLGIHVGLSIEEIFMIKI